MQPVLISSQHLWTPESDSAVQSQRRDMQPKVKNSRGRASRRGCGRFMRVLGAALVSALVLCWSGLAGAQHTTGTLRGQVSDQTGATVAGMEVTHRSGIHVQ